MIYYLLVTTGFSIYLLERFTTSIGKYKQYLLAYWVLSIILIGGLRYNVGTDFTNYRDIIVHDLPIEPAFKILANIIGQFSTDYALFVLVFYVISFYLKYICFHKLSGVISLSIMMYLSFYFIAYDVNAMREGMAFAFTGLAGYHAYKKNIVFYLLCCLLAFLFHYTAIIFFPFYFLIRIRLRWWMILSGILICSILSYKNFVGIVIQTLSELGNDSNIIARAVSYGTNTNYESNLLLTFSTVRRCLISFCIYVIIRRASILDERMQKMLIMTNFIALLIYLLFCQFGLFAIRLSVYFRFFECISFSYLPFVFKKKKNELIVVSLLYFYAVLQIYSALSLEDNNLLPYHTIFYNAF